VLIHCRHFLVTLLIETEHLRLLLQDQNLNLGLLDQRKLWQAASEQALQAITAAGVKVIYPDKALFEQRVEAMHAELVGSPAYEVLQQIKSL